MSHSITLLRKSWAPSFFNAGHYDFAVLVVFILELFDRALAAGAHRAHGGMPAKVGQVVAKVYNRFEEVFSFGHIVRLTFYVQFCHLSCKLKNFFDIKI